MSTRSSAFLDFYNVAEQVRATPKRLEKAAFLRDYFTALSDDDLSLAARFFAGNPFALRDQRVVNIGESALRKAILEATQTDENTLRSRIVQTGDVGDAAFDFFPQHRVLDIPETLSLQGVFDFFQNLAATKGTKNKAEIVGAILRNCNALEAKYLIKLLSGDLRIGLKESAVEDALAKMSNVAVAQVQWTNMIIGDIGETALLARRGELQLAKLKLFAPIKFMLASPAADLTEVARQMPDTFAVEDKFDGIRAQAHIAPANIEYSNNAATHGIDVINNDNINSGARVALFSRTLDEITASFPDLHASLAQLSAHGELILDGEIVAMRNGEILPFQSLQPRLGRKTLTDEMLAQVPVVFVAYDILYGDNRVLMDDDWTTRRRVVESLGNYERFRVCDSSLHRNIARLDEEFDAARLRGNEGLMCKDPRATYKPGRRGREWLKIKRALATLDVVVTSVEVGSGRRSKFLSDFTFAVRASEEDSTLLNVGKAYSGLTDKEIEELSIWFKEHTIAEFAHGKVRTVEPLIVIEITFDRVQPSPRHKSGFALRFPRILRLRADKPVSEIDTLETVRRLAES